MELFFEKIFCYFDSRVDRRLRCNDLWVLLLIKYLSFLDHVVNIVLQVPNEGNFLDCVFFNELNDLKFDLRGILVDNLVVFFHFLYRFLAFFF